MQDGQSRGARTGERALGSQAAKAGQAQARKKHKWQEQAGAGRNPVRRHCQVSLSPVPGSIASCSPLVHPGPQNPSILWSMEFGALKSQTNARGLKCTGGAREWEVEVRKYKCQLVDVSWWFLGRTGAGACDFLQGHGVASTVAARCRLLGAAQMSMI